MAEEGNPYLRNCLRSVVGGVRLVGALLPATDTISHLYDMCYMYHKVYLQGSLQV